jgi:hypothetical protein
MNCHVGFSLPLGACSWLRRHRALAKDLKTGDGAKNRNLYCGQAADVLINAEGNDPTKKALTRMVCWSAWAPSTLRRLEQLAFCWHQHPLADNILQQKSYLKNTNGYVMYLLIALYVDYFFLSMDAIFIN